MILTGHATAAPATSVMNSRRCIANPPMLPARAQAVFRQAVGCPKWVIRVDARVPVDVRLASIFGQAPRHSQAVANPLEGVRLRNLGSIGPAADHAGRKEVRQILFRLSQATTKPRIPVSFETLREAHHLIARLTPTSR
jgi:hypothetical protein